MKHVKNLIWIMILLWLSTVVFNSVYDIYNEGSIWKLITWIFVIILLAIYVFTVGRAIHIIAHNDKSDNPPPKKPEE